MEKIFGPNWKTTVSAILTFISFAAAYTLSNHDTFLGLAIVPDAAKQIILEVCSFIGFVSALIGAYNTVSQGGAVSSHEVPPPKYLGVYRRHKQSSVNWIQWAVLLILLYIAVLLSFVYPVFTYRF